MALFERHTRKARKAAAQPGPHVVEPCRYKLVEDEARAAESVRPAERGEAVVNVPPVVPARPSPATGASERHARPILSGGTLATPHESLSAALEPELRRVIDTAVAKVAAIELDAIQQTRELTQRAAQEGREHLEAALQRASELMSALELFATTVNGMVFALRLEVDEALEVLEQVTEAESDLSREPDARQATVGEAEAPEPGPEAQTAPAAEPTSRREPEMEQSAGPVAAEPSTNGAAPEAEPEVEPSPELTEMFREQIVKMRDSGKTREQAERSLLRFNLGRRFLPLLDEIYSGQPDDAGAPEIGQRRTLLRRLFARH